MTTSVPQYLQRPAPAPVTYGTLRRDGDQWVIDGDPQVIILAKRLFPGSAGRGRNTATFPATRRTFGDLVWLQQRWPLQVVDVEAWEAAYQETTEYVARRDAFNAGPRQAMPPALFTGTLRPFQAEGLAWMLANRRTLLADEMGLGKTPQALAALAALGQWPALIVAPPHLIRHWEEKIGQFLAPQPKNDGGLFGPPPAGVTVQALKGRKPTVLRQAHIYLCHYLLLADWRHRLKELAPRVIVFDEVQELRHGGTMKYSAASDLATSAENVFGLSGTPIYNRGGEIWHVLNILEYHALGDWDSFTREWAIGYGSDIIQHPDVLGAHLRREGLLLRRRKEDVLTELPAKRRIVETVESKEGLAADLMRRARELATAAAEQSDILARGRIEREAVNSARQATGIAKAESVALFVRGLLEAEEPCLVFAYHHAVFEILMRELRAYHPVKITGEETKQQKWEAQEAFRTGKAGVVLISLRAATGLDGLQERARCVVFAELDWAPAVHAQAEDRAHRMGQPDSVLCYYLVSREGTDPDVQEALGLKISQFVGLMGDEPESTASRELAANVVTDHMRRVLEKLRAA